MGINSKYDCQNVKTKAIVGHWREKKKKKIVQANKYWSYMLDCVSNITDLLGTSVSEKKI